VNLLGDERSAVAFLSPSIAVAGETPAVRNVIDHRHDNIGLPQRLQEPLKRIPSTNQIWFAGDLPWHPEDQAFAAVIENVQTVSGGVNLQSGLAASVVAQMPGEQEARQLHQAVRAAIGLGRLNTPNERPELLRVYDSIQATVQGQSVRLNLDVPQKLLDELMRAAGPLFEGKSG
jgi:hypothetical protein